jgi:TolB-like protein/predicted metal-dependent HD superfamily phosphohydrolase/Tfp pilus assembly protein PilF
MSSVIPGFEYDIFISYRHKDNKPPSGFSSTSQGSQPAGGWVSEFVKDLSKELESTFKEDLSIYFDSNPVDGLLETHDVDKSLEGKLKSVIFIPILSQIYCDPRSYAWQNEFCAFNKAAQKDPMGRDIKLRTGNVASRILPVMIHQLDPEDRNLLEKELNSKLRCIEFIFRSPGVNRPLRPDDNRADNSSNLFYRDQINKVANAVKEIITAIKYPDRVSEPYQEGLLDDAGDAAYVIPVKPKEESIQEKSIAVLPFVSLSQDPSQEYFADGITENILIQLASLPQLRVISRTSVMRYKKTDKSAPEIAAELGVKFILEGSAQAHGNKVRITVQLIDAAKDHHIWSKVFVESMDDIFEIQSNVAEVVANELKSSLKPQENEKLKEIPTKNLEAYDLFLKGRHSFNQWSVDGYRTASEYFRKAIEKDPDFKQAYSYLASSYSARMSWNGDMSPSEALPLINTYLNEAWKRGATDNDYLTKAFVEFFINKDFQASEKLLLKAREVGPNNAQVIYTYSYLLEMMNRLPEALNAVSDASKIEPHSVAYFNYKGIALYLQQRYEEAAETWQEAMKLFPMVIRFYDFLGRLFLTTGKYQEAIDIIDSGWRISPHRQPSMTAYLAASFYKLGKQEKANELLQQLISRSAKGEKGVNIYIVHIFCAMDDLPSAYGWLQKAEQTNDIDLIWKNVDPLLKDLRNYSPSSQANVQAPDYAAAQEIAFHRLQNELPSYLHYHNVAHTRDVVTTALAIAQQEGVDQQELQILKTAACYHDLGFVISTKNHEANGCEIAREILPGFGFSADQIERVCGMIMATKIPQTPKNHLEQILCDADLDYLGRDDFYTTGRTLFEEMKERGFVETEREWNLIQKTFLENHRYHTRFSKENREARKQTHLQEILAKLQPR